MREVVTKVYKFEELSDEGKKKAIENNRDINTDYSWHDSAYEEFEEILNNIGVDCTHKDILFSGFWNQGDGLSFTGTYSYRAGALAYVKNNMPKWTELHTEVAELQRLQKRYFYGLGGELTRSRSCGHVHEKTVSFELNGDVEVKDDSIEGRMQDCFRSIMKEFYKHLEKEYEYRTGDESISECLISNEYEFTEDGKIWHENK